MPRIKPPRSQQQEEHAELAAIESHDPPVEDIEIELIDEPSGGAEIEIAAAPEPAPAAAAPATPAADDNPLQRALDAQARAEEIARTAQARADDLTRRDHAREAELSRERGDREEAEYNSVLTAIAAEQSSLDKATADYAAFSAAGEWGNAAKAQRIISTAAARLDRLEDNKVTFDSKREAARADPPSARQPAAAAPVPVDFESKLATIGVPEPGKAWLRKHPEFVNDPTHNKKIGAAHNYLTDVEGIEPFSTAYFDALDTRFGFKTPPATPAAEATPPKQRSIPMSAPVSRDVPTPSGERQPSSKVTLTAEERQIARTSFTSDMTNAQKELLYARNKAKLARMKANGEYQERTS